MRPIILTLVVLTLSTGSLAQVPANVGVQILKAEDARRYDKTVEDLMASPDVAVRTRGALAAGRIGNDAAVAPLGVLLQDDPSAEVRAMAAFALGEIESIKGAATILRILDDPKAPNAVRARAIEAAGKIAAANATDPKAKELGRSILATLEAEDKNSTQQDREVIQHGITAALRARPEKADVTVAKFLTNADPRLRGTAANTLTRLRAKNADKTLRAMLEADTDAVARANAARALGAAEDKEAIDLLVSAATGDADARVRVSAIRALAALKDAKAAPGLIARGDVLLALHSKSKLPFPNEKSELLEIATTLGRLLPNTEDNRGVSFINQLRMEVSFTAPETEIALARIAPMAYVAARLPADFGYWNPQVASAYAQGLAEIATTKDEDLRMQAAQILTRYIAGMANGVKPRDQAKMMRAMPDLMRAMAAFKPDNLDEILRGQLANEDVFLRAAAAELIGDRPVTPANVAALKTAASRAMIVDKAYNDAQLGIMDALFKLDKKESLGVVLMNLNAPDYLVRKKAFELLRTVDVKESPGVPSFIESAVKQGKDRVLPYTPIFGTKLGQLLNTDVDYRRALARKNGSVKAVFTTEKGTFTIDLSPEDAPLTVDNFVRLARLRYFNGREVHRVVPNFVMQDGDPRGDGNGGPGWSIRCEVNMVGYDRGSVGMALSGKDTGGSQWFVTHSPQPHLDGGYTVFGHVDEAGMKVVDNIVRGDKIISVRIVEGRSPQKSTKGTKGTKR